MFSRNTTFVAILLASVISPVFAEQPPALLEMNADGEVQIAPDGHVSAYLLKSKLSPTVADLVDRNVRGWTFEPVVIDGKAVVAKTVMHIKLKAELIADQKDNYKIQIVNVWFGEPRRIGQMKPPHYPEEAIRAHLGAKVLLSLRLDETGKVIDAEPYQTSLDARTRSEAEADRWRRAFERASIAAAKTWQYNMSETINGKPIGMTALVPVEFFLRESGVSQAPEMWKAFLPGPVHQASWLGKSEVADAQDPSTLHGDQALSLDSHFRLKDNVIGRTL